MVRLNSSVTSPAPASKKVSFKRDVSTEHGLTTGGETLAGPCSLVNASPQVGVLLGGVSGGQVEATGLVGLECVPVNGAPTESIDGRGGCLLFASGHSAQDIDGGLQAFLEKSRLLMIERSIGADKVALLRNLELLDEVAEAACPVLTDDGGDEVLAADTWFDTVIHITLDSGCCEHVMDFTDAPWYHAYIVQSAGSKRKQNFVVGNSQKLPNEGEIHVNLSSNGTPLRSVFQVAEVTRPLMSVGRVCDQGVDCLFKKDYAVIIDEGSREVCRFERVGGLYVTKLDLKRPDLFGRPA